MLQVFLGPTGIGKTARATSLARSTGAPVVVLDRIQCHPEIATASGRPLAAEVCGTTRIYLDERSVGAGELSAEEGLRRFMDTVGGLELGARDLVIVEGGSVSLCRLWHGSGLFPFERQELQVLGIDDPHRHRGQVLRRVRAMVSPGHNGESIIDEFSRVWRHHAGQRDFIASVCGFDAIVEWCQQAEIPPGDVCSSALSPDQQNQLVIDITNAHCSYARAQSDFFTGMRQEIRPRGRRMPAQRASATSEVNV
ncbi:isopentenyl transferase family protein [Streptomyces sp. NPDC048419]|uniref:isopentenyl transferase family protein n=1 Tax=Streptomyces sp. NPDC048419 TaxID=3365547 RepID=UPI00371C86CE